MWLECISVGNGCCCKEIYRFPHNITYPYSTCISSFFAAASLLLCSLFTCFFILLLGLLFCSYNIEGSQLLLYRRTLRVHSTDIEDEVNCHLQKFRENI